MFYVIFHFRLKFQKSHPRQFLQEWRQNAIRATIMAALKAIKAAIIICSDSDMGL